MGEGFGQWFFFMYLCIQEKRAVSLSIVRQNGSHKSVKKLLHFCYTTTWTNQLGSCYTTKYERVVHFPLSPQIAVIQQVTAIFFDYDRDSIYCFNTILWNPGSFLRSPACNQVGYTCRKNPFFHKLGLGSREKSLLGVFSRFWFIPLLECILMDIRRVCCSHRLVVAMWKLSPTTNTIRFAHFNSPRLEHAHLGGQ